MYERYVASWACWHSTDVMVVEGGTLDWWQAWSPIVLQQPNYSWKNAVIPEVRWAWIRPVRPASNSDRPEEPTVVDVQRQGLGIEVEKVFGGRMCV